MNDTVPTMPEMNPRFTSADIKAFESNAVLADETLDQLLTHVRWHKAGFDVPCPPWCAGNVFDDWIRSARLQEPRMIDIVLRAALVRLAGYDTD